MARALYCWRCKRVVPMLDEPEWRELAPLLPNIAAIKTVLATHGVGLEKATALAHEPALARFNTIAGAGESDGRAIWHHRLALYGPPCSACGKPLRTPCAKLCAACGAPR